jgi:probable HAF family extracellular repeat protein
MNNIAAAINNRGQIAGLSDLAGDTTGHAFLWQDGVMNDLGTLPGDVFSLSSGMNNKGQVVGQSCDVNFNCRAILWENGVMTDLNTLIPAGSSLFLIYGSDINDQGEIAGGACVLSNGACTNEMPAFLAIPCDDAHAGLEGCGDRAQRKIGIEGPRVVLPENLREQLRQRKGFGQLGAWPVRPQ